MSDITTELERLHEQTRRHRAFMDIQHRISELQSQRTLKQLEREVVRSERMVLGFIPGDVAALWPWLLVVVLSSLMGAVAGTMLVHALELATACRGVGAGP